MLTGSTTVAIKHNKGVILSTDTMLNFGRLLVPFKSRIFVINGTVFTFNGKFADIQELIRLIEEENTKHAKTFLRKADKTQEIYSNKVDENKEFPAFDRSKGISSFMFAKFIQRLLYSRRSQMDPLQVNVTVAGRLTHSEKEILEENHYTKFQKVSDDFFLAGINTRGLFYQSNVVCTGLAQHMSTPHLRGDETEIHTLVDAETAAKRVKESMKNLYYRNCAASDEIAMCYIEKEKITVKLQKLSTEWNE